jgi:hypothetical protein
MFGGGMFGGGKLAEIGGKALPVAAGEAAAPAGEALPVLAGVSHVFCVATV